MNAKVDYTLLDRWRHGQVLHSGRRLDGSAAPAARPESHRAESSRQDSPDGGSLRIVHTPLAD